MWDSECPIFQPSRPPARERVPGLVEQDEANFISRVLGVIETLPQFGLRSPIDATGEI